jgi:hypothetical protein
LKHIHCIYYLYKLYYIVYNCFNSILCSGQLQQPPHCVWQGICVATPGNDASLIQGCYCGPDNRVASRAVNTAVPFVHRHPCAAGQWLDQKRYTYSVHWQIGVTLSCFYWLFIDGRWWGVHCNHVSHDTVHNLLVSQGSTAGHWPGVPFQKHTGDSCWVGNS